MYYLAINIEADDGSNSGGEVIEPGSIASGFVCYSYTENTWADLSALPGWPAPGMYYIETQWEAWKIPDLWLDVVEWYCNGEPIETPPFVADVSTVENVHANNTRIFMDSDKSIKAVFYPRRITGMFVRGDEVQVTYNDGSFARTPDWGETWWGASPLPPQPVDVSCDATNPYKSVLLGGAEIYHTKDTQLPYSDFIYVPTTGQLYGSPICSEMALDFGVCYIATNKGIQKTFNFGEEIFIVSTMSNIIDIAIGGTIYPSGNKPVLTVDAIDPDCINIYVNNQQVSVPYSGEYYLDELVIVSGYATGGYTWWWEGDVSFPDSYQEALYIKMSDDKSVVATNFTAEPISVDGDSRTINDRQSFYAAGRYWVTWKDGDTDNWWYSTSLDELSWSAPSMFYSYQVEITTGEIYYDSLTNFIHCVRLDYDDNLYYRRGIPLSNGTISWNNEQLIANADFWKPSITVDDSGYAYVFTNFVVSTTTWYARIYKNNNTDGTWSTAAGYPQDWETHTGGGHYRCYLQRAQDHVVAAWSKFDSTIRVKVLTGTTWGSTFYTTDPISSGSTFNIAPWGEDAVLLWKNNLAEPTFAFVDTSSASIVGEITLSCGEAISTNYNAGEIYVYDSYISGNYDQLVRIVRNSSGVWSGITVLLKVHTNYFYVTDVFISAETDVLTKGLYFIRWNDVALTDDLFNYTQYTTPH